MKITYERLFIVLGLLEKTLARQNETIDNPKSKFGYAAYKFNARAESLRKKFAERKEDLLVAHCATEKINDQDVIIRDKITGQYSFAKAEQRAVTQQIEGLLGEQVEIEPYFAQGKLPDLTLVEKEYFSGLLITEDQGQISEDDFAE